MARVGIIVAIVCSLALPTLRADDDNPFIDLAASFLQNMGDAGNGNGMAALGGLMGSLMQGDGARNLGSLFGQGGDAGDVISGTSAALLINFIHHSYYQSIFFKLYFVAL